MKTRGDMSVMRVLWAGCACAVLATLPAGCKKDELPPPPPGGKVVVELLGEIEGLRKQKVKVGKNLLISDCAHLDKTGSSRCS